jgi:hypothetical protein
VQNSLPAAASAVTHPVYDADDTNANVEGDWQEDLCLPSTNFFANELGRTAEEFVLPKK